MDAAVEEMTQSVIFIEDNFQNTQEECLVDMGKHMVVRNQGKVWEIWNFGRC